MPGSGCQREQIPRANRPVNDLGHQPLQIIDPRQPVDQITAFNRLIEELRDSSLTAANMHNIEQRLFEIFAHQPLAHCSFGMVEHPQQ